MHYEYETEEWSSTSTKPFKNFNTNENFNPSKNQTLFKSYNLSELFYYTKENKMKIFEEYEIKRDYDNIQQYNSYKSKSFIFSVPENINNLYQISNDELSGYMKGYNFDTNVNDIKYIPF